LVQIQFLVLGSPVATLERAPHFAVTLIMAHRP